MTLLGWKTSSKNKLGWPLVPNLAEVDNAESLRLAAAALDALGVVRGTVSNVPADPGGPLEHAVRDHLADALPGRHPDRGWQVSRGTMITRFDQYAHLDEVHALVRANPGLRITIGMDYLIRPDVTVGLAGGADRVRAAAATCGGLVQMDNPLGPSAEHPARVLADDPAPPRSPAAFGHGDSRAAA